LTIVPEETLPGDPDVLFVIHEQIVDVFDTSDVRGFSVGEREQTGVRSHPENSVCAFGQRGNTNITQANGQSLERTATPISVPT
jgi:hypothetical protein